MTFCVYIHRKATTGEVFYVGKGKGFRPYKVTGRNPLWENIYNKHGRNVEIVLGGLTEDQAFKLEQDFIEFFGRLDTGTGCLVNMTDGGDGVSGYKWKPAQILKIKQRTGMLAPRTDKKMWTFHNLFTGETVVTTRVLAEREYPKINIFTPYYKRSATKDGWIIEERFDFDNLEAIKSGWTKQHNWNTKEDRHDIVNVISGEVKLQVSRLEMNELEINSSALILKSITASNGWTLKDSFETLGNEHLINLIGRKGVLNGNADNREYCLIHCRTLEKFVGKRCDFETKYNVNVADLFYSNPTLTAHGWSLQENFIKYNLKEKTDTRTYLFEHAASCTIFEGTRKEFKDSTGCNPRFFFKAKPYKISAGWTLIGLA